jgi:Tol biopolymer transport system component
MGEVYRARDMKLNRDVAIKVLPDSFAQNTDRLARFDREAQVLASLNYPNIAAIYGVEDRALIMELVEGQTLAERIAQGPIPLDEALPIARQIADALEYAHERGVVHRDLKPANIKLAPDGRVKVLDFGLAKALTSDLPARINASSPTLTMEASLAGVILGTAGYMSPEQAKGKPVDRRTDIWAFGVVLYEMLTARPLYTGENVSETLAAVIMKEPELSALPPNTSAGVKKLLRRTLERDVQQRLQAIGEARIILQHAISGEPAEDTPTAAPAPSRSVLPWAAAAGVLLVIGILLAFRLWHASRPIDRPLLSLSVDLGSDAQAGQQITAAVSRDGTRIAYPVRTAGGKQALAVRLLSQPAGTLLAGTEGGINPFFSPDGKWIAYFGGGKLKKISVTGGASVDLCEAASGRGGSWSADGFIVATLGNSSGIYRLPDGGGAAELLTRPSEVGDATHRWPQILPDSQAVIFTAQTNLGRYDDARVDAFIFKTGQRKTLLRGGYYGRYLPSGHLVYVHQGTLFGVRFDPARLEVKSSPTPLVERVAGSASLGGGQFDFSQNGTFIYLSGEARSVGSWPLVWISPAGKTEPVIAAPGTYGSPRISPDGKHVALTDGAGNADVWIHSLNGGAASRITFDGWSHGPLWAPDGRHIVYFSEKAGAYEIKWMRSDGAGEAQRLLESKDFLVPTSFSADGRRLLFHQASAATRYDIWTLPLDMADPEHPKPGKPDVFMRTPANEMSASFSPDGRWIAYTSDESGNTEVYVRPFSGDGKWQVSTGGGFNPIWSPMGRRLFYGSPDRRVFVVDYTGEGDSFQKGIPRLWIDKPILNTRTGGGNLFDVAKVGERILLMPQPETTEEPKENLHLTFLLDFFDEVARRIPVDK